MRTLSLSVVTLGAVLGKPCRKSEPSLTNLLSQGLLSSRAGDKPGLWDRVALCIALAHIHSVAVKSPMGAMAFVTYCSPSPTGHLHPWPAKYAPALGPLCGAGCFFSLEWVPSPAHFPQVCLGTAFSVPSTGPAGGRHPGSICWKKK